ncbi:hypothetical protein [Enterobacter asburiae]|uniref:hypothetical protein n=1 Tax=Enterobacter asburiae TaxID=61645 RepID=UPI000753513D|nr:hypothetical protein [Enterobacter asburiae]KVJ11238.1 hypothetical protein AWS40_21070 [Enterobacter asburiae]CZX20117.1 Uncharacterised protein [Enterobacter cloacae]
MTTYYIHPAAFGSTKNPGYGHVAVVRAEDFEKLRTKLEAAENLAKQQGNIAVALFDEVKTLRRNADDKAPELRSQLEEAEKRIAELEAREVTLPEKITSANAPEVFEIAVEAERLGLRGAYASYAVGWNACRAAMLQGSEPVTTAYKLPEGWVAVPIEPTEDMIVNGFESEPDESFSDAEVWEAYDAMSGCQQAAHRAKLCWAAMIAAAPKPEA